MVTTEVDNYKILDSKKEMIVTCIFISQAFIIDFNEDIHREDMFSSDTE